MKKAIYFLVILLMSAACVNQEFEYPDYDYNAVYFPLQYPVRTLVLGEDRIDNSLDKELKFLIGVAIGGLYKNKRDWNVEYAVDPALVGNLVNQDNTGLKVLPSQYYTLSSSPVVIPSGAFSGFVEVQLKESFLDDTLATFSNYVIPLRITRSDADSVLRGKPEVNHPNIHILSDWDPGAPPKDFVLFGIKFINPYHGYYLQRGKIVTYDTANKVINTRTYREKYVERDKVVKIVTTGRNKVVTNFLGINTSSDGKNSMLLTVNNSGDIVVSSTNQSTFKASGTGKYVLKGDEWGGMRQNAIYLQYSYMEGNNRHEVSDTLVFRNNGVSIETNTVTVVP